MKNLQSAMKNDKLTLFLLIFAHFGSFYGAKLLNLGRVHRILSIPADALVPFVPGFILFYILAYAQWVLCYFVLFRQSRPLFRKIAWASILSETLAFALFLLVPTCLERPDAAGDGLWLALTRLIYSCDTPTNLFPSLHCLQSWLCWRGIRELPGLSRCWKTGCLILTLLVFASTVLVKQHLLIDPAGAVLAAELGLYLVRRKEASARE